MDSHELVKSQIDDGRMLIFQLVRDGMKIAAAFWAWSVEDEDWAFGLVSPMITDHQSWKDAIGQVMGSLNELPDMLLTLNDIDFIDLGDPIAKDVLKALNGSPGRAGPRYAKRMLGTKSFEGVYIYPAWYYEPRGACSMSTNEVVRKVVDLMGQPEVGEVSTITLTNGVTFQGSPIGLERINDGMSVKFVVEPLYSPRNYPVSEIAEIQ